MSATTNQRHFIEQNGISVTQYGAKGDGVTDDSDAFMAAIRSYDPSGTRGGKVFIPYSATGYYFAKSVIVDRAVILEGFNGSRAYPGSEIIVPAGVTAFKFYNVQSSPTGKGADWSIIRDLYIRALGRDKSHTTGSITASTSTLSVASAAGFSVGQIIRVNGAGVVAPMYGVRATTTAGSANVVIHPAEGSLATHGLISRDLADGVPGNVVQIAGANFPGGTYVVSWTETSAVLSNVAGASVVAGQVTVLEDLFGEIQAISGNTLTLESNNGDGTTVTNALVTHADAGISLKCRVRVENVAVRFFQGNGIHLRSSSGDGPPSNANLWRMTDVHVLDCANGLWVSGVDANAGSFCGGDVSLNREWGLIDSSQNGNGYEHLHVSGGRGYRTICPVGRSTFHRCYAEGGTYSSFSPGTLILGGNLGQDEGGFNIQLTGDFASLNAHRVGKCQEGSAYSDFSHTWLPYGRGGAAHPTLWQVRSNPAKWPHGTTWDFRQTEAAGDYSKGWWGTMPQGRSGDAPMLFSDGDAFGAAETPGHAWFPKGYWMGSTDDLSAAYVDDSQARRTLLLDAPPASGSWRNGDTVQKRTPVKQGSTGAKYLIIGWKRVAGVWEEMRVSTGD